MEPGILESCTTGLRKLEAIGCAVEPTALGITIAGLALAHLLCVFVLPYSNWEWATVCQSESMAALRRGVQSTLFRLGRWNDLKNVYAKKAELATTPAEKKQMLFVLGQVLSMNASHGGQAKHEKIDAPTMAVWLRGGMRSQASVEPAARRATRALLRRRLPRMRTREEKQHD